MFRSIAFVSVIALLFFGDITVSTCPYFAETEYARIEKLVTGMTYAENNEDACLEVFKFVLEKIVENGEDCECYTEHPLYETYTKCCNDEGHALHRNMAGNDKVVDADEPDAARFETFML